MRPRVCVVLCGCFGVGVGEGVCVCGVRMWVVVGGRVEVEVCVWE